MKRRRQTPPRYEKAGLMNVWHSTPRVLFWVLLLLQRQNSCLALLPSSSPVSHQSPNSRGSAPYRKIGSWTTIVSPPFSGTTRRLQLERRRGQQEFFSRSSSSATALPMVLTTPESIIEQASTVNLLDDLIDESVRTSPRRPIMMQFDPSSGWIWRRWKGTIFSETWTSCVKNMIYASIIFFLYKQYPGVKDHLNGFGTLWGQLLSVTTFTLTFFVNQSYALWRKCYELSRRLQGRLHDIGMNLATHATRKVPTTPDETSTYTAASRQILELMSRYIRLFDLLTYASFTRSHRPILTPRGMRRLVERGLMTAQEREVLVDAAIPATQRHSAILMWMIRLFVEGRSSGHIQGGDGFEQQTMEKFHIIRAQYGAIGDELQGRMPLAYAHVVQILVDLILWMYPVMAFSISMSPVVAILGTGLLTLSYQGLFDLAKQFLDPYDNENYGKGEDPLSVDTLIAETNAGSVRWMYGFEEMPFSQEKLKDGELYDYLLPVRGYSLEELAQMEEEKLQRKKELEEQRVQEEQERLQREAEEAKIAEEKGDSIDEAEESNETPAEGDDPTNGEDWDPRRVAADEQEISPKVEDRPVHKITTLADGTVVSFKEEPVILTAPPQIIVSDAKPVAPSPGIPQGVAPYLASLSTVGPGQRKVRKRKVPVNDQKTELVDYDALQDLPFFEEIAPIDKEMPLSQIIADEEMEGATEVVAMTLSREEYETKIAESKGNPQIEVLDAMEIMTAPPVYFVKEKRIDSDSFSSRSESQLQVDAAQNLDEASTRTDKASLQLESTNVPEAVGSTGDSVLLDESSSGTTIVESMGDKSISEFQSIGDNAVDTTSSSSEGPEAIPRTNEENISADDSLDGGTKSKARAAEENKESKRPSRLTLDDYNEQVEKIMEAAKEELLETEAILKARPGADPLGWDYDDEQLAPSTDGSEEGEEYPEGNVVDEDDSPFDLDVLEMDMANDDDKPEASQRLVEISTIGLETETDFDQWGSINSESYLKTPTEENEGTVTGSGDEIDALETTNVMERENEKVAADDFVEAKGTDRIEPIFIDDDDVIEEDTDDETVQEDSNDESDEESEFRL